MSNYQLENYLYTYLLHDTAFGIKTRSKTITAGKQCILIVRTCWLCYELVDFEHINYNQEASLTLLFILGYLKFKFW